MKRLKEKWNIRSNGQFVVILVVFALTGSAAAKLAGPLMDLLGLHREAISGWIYWPLRILLIFPIYQVLLVAFGWLFGQFAFFWAFEMKMLKRMGGLNRFFE